MPVGGGQVATVRAVCPAPFPLTPSPPTHTLLVPLRRRRILYLAISGIAAILFSAYLVFDIQAMMGGRYASYSPDDYVAAALAIYLDVINIFIAILNIIGMTSNN